MYAPKTVTISRAGGQITFAGNGAYRFRITDLRGRCVLSSTGAGPAMVETKALPAGTYLADIVRAGIRAHSKIVVSQ
jgi:microcystin-dependent protein